MLAPVSVQILHHLLFNRNEVFLLNCLFSDISKEKWDAMMAANHWNTVELRDNRYNQIVHMVSAANGAEEFYSTEVCAFYLILANTYLRLIFILIPLFNCSGNNKFAFFFRCRSTLVVRKVLVWPVN